MPDYALMNQNLYEGKAKEVEQMTKDALAEGRHFQEVLNDGLIAGMASVATVASMRPNISFLWHNVIGATVVFVVGLAISLAGRPNPSQPA